MYYSNAMNQHPFNIKYPADFFVVKQVWRANLKFNGLSVTSFEEKSSDNSDLVTIPFSGGFQNEAMANMEAVL
jgi:hypothetical protein